MTPGAFNTIVIPPIASGGMITVTIGSDVATGDATSGAALFVGAYFLLTGKNDRYQCVSTPENLGGGVYQFRINRVPSATLSLQAWVITLPASEEALNLIFSHDDAGNTAGRAAHDASADGYLYLDTQATRIWERNGPTGTWTDAATTVVLWVATTGSDSDDTNPQLLTVQAAVDRLAGAGDLSGWIMIIALKAGTYASAVTLKDVQGVPASLSIMGEASLTGTPSNSSYTISSSTLDAIKAVGIKSVWTLDGFTVSSAKGHAILAKNARVRFNQLRFGTTSGSHISAMGGSTVVLSGNGYTISGNANAHLNANGSGAVVDLQAEAVARPTITISAAVSFKTAFAWARASGQIFTGTGLVFTNKTNVTGRRWRAEQNSSIDSGQSGEKYLPGTIAGIAVKSGEYI